MDDLISRQAVIDLLKKNTTRDIEDIIITNKHIKLIADMPKAYDVDAVVEELEEVEQSRLEMCDWQGQSAISDAIDIVKRGGVE